MVLFVECDDDVNDEYLRFFVIFYNKIDFGIIRRIENRVM